jgi:hypothetical protein
MVGSSSSKKNNNKKKKEVKDDIHEIESQKQNPSKEKHVKAQQRLQVDELILKKSSKTFVNIVTTGMVQMGPNAYVTKTEKKEVTKAVVAHLKQRILAQPQEYNNAIDGLEKLVFGDPNIKNEVHGIIV